MTRHPIAIRHDTTVNLDPLRQQQQDLDAINRARVHYLYGQVWGRTLPAYPLEMIVQIVNQVISEVRDAR